MKVFIIYISLFISFNSALFSQSTIISNNYRKRSILQIERLIINNEINKKDTIAFYKLLRNRDLMNIYKRIDSLFNNGYRNIYIVETFEIKTKKLTLTEKYFSEKDPNIYKFLQSTKSGLKNRSVQCANFNYVNGIKKKASYDTYPFKRNYLEAIENHIDSLNTLDYTIPVIVDTIITPGCSGTSSAVESRKLKLQKKYNRKINSRYYQIETYIDNQKIFISFQIPSKQKPFILIEATTF